LVLQEELMKQGNAPTMFFCATNKDELTTLKKQKLGKTRVFLQSGLDLTLLTRRYFGHFISNYLERMGFDICSAVGCDKDSVWGAFKTGLESRGGNGFDIDFSNYDGSVPQCAVECFLEVVNNYYEDEYSLVREAIFHSVVHSVVIAGELVFEKDVGITSGIVGTEITNTVENLYLMLIAYQVAKDSAGLEPSLKDFDENVRMLAYGDDVIMGVTDEVLSFYNRKTIKEVMKFVGMTVTAANKEAAIIPFEPVSNLSFLKSEFIQRDGYVACPLPRKVIHRELIWEKKVNTGDETIMTQKIDVAMQMMAHHGEEAVDQLREQLKQQRVSVDFDFKLWEIKIRDKQEIAYVEGVSKRGTNAIEYYLGDDEEFKDAFDFDVDWDL